MAIKIREAADGYISQKDDLRQGKKGPVLVIQLGQKHYRREPDGSYTQTGISYIPLVLFGAAAEAANDRFIVGDDVVALGERAPRTYERDGQRVEVVEFRTAKLIFDTSHPRYETTRTRRTDPPSRTAGAVPDPATAEEESPALAGAMGMER